MLSFDLCVGRGTISYNLQFRVSFEMCHHCMKFSEAENAVVKDRNSGNPLSSMPDYDEPVLGEPSADMLNCYEFLFAIVESFPDDISVFPFPIF